jgi:regulator of replication initiation timing
MQKKPCCTYGVITFFAKLNKILEKIQDQPTDTSARELATMEELAALRAENKKLLEELQTVKCDLASKNAAIKEVRQSKEEQARMHQQWTSMCTSMLGTIENIKK